MSKHRFKFDAWIDDELRAVTLPDGLTARLRRIASARVSRGTDMALVPRASRFASRSLATSPVPLALSRFTTRELDAAVAAVPLPDGLIGRLRAIGAGRGRAGGGARFRRALVAAALLVVVGASYGASLAAFLCGSYPAARLAAAERASGFFEGLDAPLTMSTADDADQLAAQFELAPDCLQAAEPEAGDLVAGNSFLDDPWRNRAAHDELLLASADDSAAISEYLDRLWQTGRSRNGKAVVLSSLPDGDEDEDCGEDSGDPAGCKPASRHSPGWPTCCVRSLANWPCVAKLVELLHSVGKDSAAQGALKARSATGE